MAYRPNCLLWPTNAIACANIDVTIVNGYFRPVASWNAMLLNTSKCPPARERTSHSFTLTLVSNDRHSSLSRSQPRELYDISQRTVTRSRYKCAMWHNVIDEIRHWQTFVLNTLYIRQWQSLVINILQAQIIRHSQSLVNNILQIHSIRQCKSLVINTLHTHSIRRCNHS